MRDRSLLLLALVLLPGAAGAEHRVYLPVEARSGLQSPLRGATLRFGLPLSAGSRVRDVSELVLTGADRYRLVAGTWRPDRTIEWVFVGATADLPGGGLGVQLVLTTGAGQKDTSGAGQSDLPDGSAGVIVSPLREATTLAADPLLRLDESLRSDDVQLPDPVPALSTVRSLRSGRLPDGETLAALRSAGDLVSLAVAARVTSAAADLDAAFAALRGELAGAGVVGPAGPEHGASRAAEVEGVAPDRASAVRAGAVRAALLLLQDLARSDDESDLVDDAGEWSASAAGEASRAGPATPPLPPGLAWRSLAVTRSGQGITFVVPKGLRRLRVKHAPGPIAGSGRPSSGEIPFWAAINVSGERTLAPAGTLAHLDLAIPPGDQVAARYLEDAALLAPVVSFRPASRVPTPLRWALAALASGLAFGLVWALIMRRKR